MRRYLPIRRVRSQDIREGPPGVPGETHLQAIIASGRDARSISGHEEPVLMVGHDGLFTRTELQQIIRHMAEMESKAEVLGDKEASDA